MTLSESNIVNRWSMMQGKDLGTDINHLSSGFSLLFNQVFENELYQVPGSDLKSILPLVSGFAINNEGCFELCSVVECLDLCYINLDKEAAKELDWWLMNKMDWLMRYQYAMTI